MLTDLQARALMRQAAETIDVASAGPIDTTGPRRPWWPATVAAAAAVAVVAVGLALMSDDGDRAPRPAAPLTDDGRFQLGPDQVPSVFGYSAEDALAMLEERGFAPLVEDVDHCGDPGRAVGTMPQTGALVEAGTEVVVQRSKGTHGLAYCAVLSNDPDRAEAWELIDLVDGRDSALDLADEVTAYDGDVATTLPAEEVASWAPFAEVVREMSEAQQRGLGQFVWPSLSTRTSADRDCGGPRPAALRGREGLVVSTAVPTDGVSATLRCQQVTLFHDDEGAVDAVRTVSLGGHPGPFTPPPVVGNSAEFAGQRLEELGYEVEVVERVDCAQPGLVVAQWPLPRVEEAAPSSAAQIAVASSRGACSRQRLPITPQTQAADALVEFFRGGPAPDFADQVTLFDTDLPAAELTGEQAAEPAAWGTLWPDTAGGVTRTESLGVCVVRGDDQSLLPDGDPVSVGDGEPRTCAEDWAALVWVDDTGAISAIDLLRGSP